ncbi:MAG: HTTM domain-containing protein [Deltaproteobacteria bacterium]|nr:HTTM domain-containing protein [Deltaproteobacteria bacterium]
MTDAPPRGLRARALAQVDPASLVAFRVIFGLLGLVGAVRFLANGWVEDLFATPTFFFRYPGFEWVPVPSVEGIYALFGVMIAGAVGVILGWRHRLSAAAYLLAFTWVELIDVTNYLNHYYLVTLLGLLVLALPLGRAGSLDARRDPSTAVTSFPAWMVWLVRLQLGVVYTYAAIAKAQPDWLVHAQPLDIWLSARAHTPVIGALFGEPGVALAMSWAGFLHDLLVPWLLLWRRTRLVAFAALCVFHLGTHLLFDIGMFPVIMTASVTIFFSPSWPRRPLARLMSRFVPRSPERPWEPPARPSRRRLVAGLVALWAAWQVLVPLRTFVYGGDVLWHEQGMRWSWRVMVREKNGAIGYRVRVDGRADELHVPPSRYLTGHQEREFSGQPDLILQLAHHIADDLRARGHTGVEVRVDALASLNGRRARRLIDPTVDLARVEDGLATASWILPAPEGPPPALVNPRLRVPAPRTAAKELP